MLNIGKANQKHKNFYFVIAGVVAGFLNGLFGAGGGTLAVELLKKGGLDEKKSHATSVAVILSLTVISTVLYLTSKRVSFSDALYFIPGGIIGALLGASLLKKLSSNVIKIIFGAVLAIISVRMILK